MAALTAKKLKNTYKDLLQVSNSNSGIDATARAVSDGEATASILKLSTTAVEVDGVLELGHATDTTLTRASAGDINIEGNIIYRAGGTDVPVTDGGTGVSTLTDGGILVGSGTGAITAMSVLSDGEMIVGDGTTDPVAESGATLRTSIGVGTGDSPTFTGLTLSGDLAVNGGDITSTSGAIAFGNENLSTTGSFGCAALTSTGIDDNAASVAITIDGNQTVLVGKASSDEDTYGIELGQNGGTGYLGATRAGGNPLFLNRLNDDGGLISFEQDGTLEGDISVYGTTVSLTSFVGAHYSQWATGLQPVSEPPSGTVVSATDEMCEWLIHRRYDSMGKRAGSPEKHFTRRAEGETWTEEVPAIVAKDGKVVKPAWTATHKIERYNNKRLVRIEVSKAKNDKRVYGVYGGINRDNGNIVVWSVGLCGEYGLRVTGPCRGGDLLVSNGDGTATLQADDIIRSSTIGKVVRGDPSVAAGAEQMVLATLNCG